MYDVIVIGAGIIGVSVARELSKFELDVLVLEKSSDLSEGTTKANSGIVHAGYDCEPGTLKAKYNVEGNKIYEQLSKDLDFPFRRNGSLVLAFSRDQEEGLQDLMEKGHKNGVKEMRILDKEQLFNMEPNMNENVYKAVYAPTGGITSPYKACIAIAENSAVNGVKYKFNTAVSKIEKITLEDGTVGYKVVTKEETYITKTLVNAAGIYSDSINNMVCEKKYEIIPRKGEYMLFDKSTAGFVRSTVFQLPSKFGKGVLVTPTIDGNTMIGPTADDISDKEDKATHSDSLEYIQETAALSVNQLPLRQVITSFVGLRAHLKEGHDFVVEEGQDSPGFYNAVGIESPGLSAAPAIAKEIAGMITSRLDPKENKEFINTRKHITTLGDLSIEDHNALIKENSAYGRIICRCESITEGEIIEAIHRPLGATTLDGIKRRVRAGMGRCQGGFCSTKILEIIAREKHIKANEVTKFGGASNIIWKD